MTVISDTSEWSHFLYVKHYFKKKETQDDNIRIRIHDKLEKLLKSYNKQGICLHLKIKLNTGKCSILHFSEKKNMHHVFKIYSRFQIQ